MTRRLGVLAGVALLVVYGGLIWADSASAADAKKKGKQEATETTQESDKEVVIRGESRLRVKAEKPEPDVTFDVDEIAVPYVKTEDYVLDVSPTSMAQPSIAVGSYLASSQTASPFIRMFKQPPILTLRPRYNSKGNIARWRLRITDSLGGVFKDFAGNGSLPEELVWDGKGGTNASEMMDVGTSYSYIFSIIDEATNPTSQMGKPIVLESLMYDEGGATVAKVVADVMFEKKDKRQALSLKGELYCREVADLLTARQNYPLVIESYAKDVDTANANGEIIQEYLAQRYLLPKDRFKVVGSKARLEKIVFKVR